MIILFIMYVVAMKVLTCSEDFLYNNLLQYNRQIDRLGSVRVLIYNYYNL